MQLSSHIPSTHARGHRGSARPGRSGSGAFTLIELMAVMAIMGVMMALAIPGLASVSRSTYLSYAARLVGDQLSLARQMALARNQPVEVRLYQFADPKLGAMEPSAGCFRAMQIFAVQEGGDFVPLGQMVRLPDSVIIDSSDTLSSVIGQAGATAKAPTLANGSDLGFSLPGFLTNYKAVTFRFLPDGSTNMTASNQWFLTMHELKDGDNLSRPPANFFTLQIEASNGRMRNFRP